MVNRKLCNSTIEVFLFDVNKLNKDLSTKQKKANEKNHVIFVCFFGPACFRMHRTTQRCFVQKVLLKISQNSQENTCVRVSFNKVASLQLY